MFHYSATLNPILYQLMSKKFRIAFKDTFGFCLPCFRSTLPEITYSNIVGGASSYKLSRTGSFYSNGSFRRSSINFEACTPTVPRKNQLANETNAIGNQTTKDVNDSSSAGKAVQEHVSADNLTGQENNECSPRTKNEKSSFLSVPSFKF